MIADSALLVPRVISTGSLQLDIALGIGGIPDGHIVEISGPIGSGKTSLCQQIIVETQKQGGLCALIDADQTWDARYALRCGVDFNQLIVSSNSQVQVALNILEVLARTGSLRLIALDSIDSLYSKSETITRPGNTIDEHIDSQLTKTLRVINNTIRKNGTTILITRKQSSNEKVIYHHLASNPSRLTIMLTAAIRLKLKTVRLLHHHGQVIGTKVRVNILKNTFNPCHHSVELDIMYKNGILKIGDLVNLGIQLALVEVIDSDFFFMGERLGGESQEVMEFLAHHRKLAEELEDNIRQVLFNRPQSKQ